MTDHSRSSCSSAGRRKTGGPPSGRSTATTCSQQLIVDNCKVAVTRHARGEAPIFNARYLDFARHHGCEPRACNPHSPHEKGRVERAVDYVKRNFLAGLTLGSLDALNAAAKLWLCTVANGRQHGATGQTPDALYAQEQPRLRLLPAERYDVATVQAVRSNRCFLSRL